jgi:hypothetical protein
MYLKLALIGLSLLVNSAMAERFDRATMDSDYEQLCARKAEYENVHPAYALAHVYASIVEDKYINHRTFRFQDAQETASALILEAWGWGFSKTKKANAEEFDLVFVTVERAFIFGGGQNFIGKIDQKLHSSTGVVHQHLNIIRKMSSIAAGLAGILDSSILFSRKGFYYNVPKEVWTQGNDLFSYRPQGGKESRESMIANEFHKGGYNFEAYVSQALQGRTDTLREYMEDFLQPDFSASEYAKSLALEIFPKAEERRKQLFLTNNDEDQGVRRKYRGNRAVEKYLNGGRTF